VKSKRLLDSYAVLAYLNEEPAAKAVEQAMKDAVVSGTSLLMSEINIGEVYFILSRKRRPEKADYFIDLNAYRKPRFSKRGRGKLY
jgi:uncharacterized protein with PIN domain